MAQAFLVDSSGNFMLKSGAPALVTVGAEGDCDCCADACIDVSPSTGVTYTMPGAGGPTVGQWYIIGGTCRQVTSITAACTSPATPWAPDSGPYPTNTCLTTGVMCILAYRSNSSSTGGSCPNRNFRLTLPAGNPMPQVGKWYNWRNWCLKIISVTVGACSPSADQTWDWPGVTYGPSDVNCFGFDMCSSNWECYCSMRGGTLTVTQDAVSGTTAAYSPGSTCLATASQPCSAHSNTSWGAFTMGNHCFGGGTAIDWGASVAGAVAISFRLVYTAVAQTLADPALGTGCKPGNTAFSVPANSWYFQINHSTFESACGSTPSTAFTAYGVATVSCVDGVFTASGTSVCSNNSSSPAGGCSAVYSFSLA